MRVKVQLVIQADEGGPETTHDIAILEKNCQRIEQLGLTLAEAKSLLTQLQQHLVARQAVAFVATCLQCKACGAPLRRKEQTTRVLRTLFGTVLLTSPRLYYCRCQPRTTLTFRPLTELLTESTTPELRFLETKWASLISYGMTARLLKDVLPLDETWNATTIQNHTLAVAQRCEEDQDVLTDSCPGDGGPLSLPKEPCSVGLDGGYVRDWEQKQRHFEVVVGKSVPSNQPATYFGFVQSYDTKAKQRLSMVLQSQGVQDTQPLTCLSDGGETVRTLPVQLYPQAEHLLDWVHLTMRMTVLGQYLKGLLRLDRVVGAGIRQTLESVKWFLWHGQVDKAVERLKDLDRRIDHFTDTYPRFPQLKKAVQQFHTYIENNRAFIPNYGQRYRNGETSSTAFVESTVHSVLSKRFVKRQSLSVAFRRWSPEFRVEESALAA